MKALNDTQIITQVETDTLVLKYNPISSKGTNTHFITSMNEIQKNGYRVPVLVTKDMIVLQGFSTVEIAKELGDKKIPIIIDDRDLNIPQIKQTIIELHETTRDITYLETCVLYYEHKILSKDDEETYTKAQAKRRGVTSRDIQYKVKYGKEYKALSSKFKSMIEEIDAKDKLTLKLVSEIVQLDTSHQTTVMSEMKKRGMDDMSKKSLNEIISPIISEIKLNQRNGTINDKLEKSKQTQNDKVLDTNFEEIDDIIENHEETISVGTMKKLFQYQIKKEFECEIDKDEESQIKDIQSACSIDFKEEIALIKSLMKKD